jgi:glycosyltransferase involved in cell wall biosynthesis
VRILHVCNYAERVGGAEVYAHSVVDALRERGYEVALFGASEAEEVDVDGLRVIQRPAHDSSRLVRDPAALSAVREYVGRFRPTLIHAHNVFSISLDVLQYLWTCGIPLLHTVHDFQLLCPNSWCVRGDGSPCPGGAGAQCFEHDCQRNYPFEPSGVLLAALRHKLLAPRTKLAIAPSRYLVARLQAHGWRDVRHLPYFVKLPPAVPRERSPHELLYVGRLEPEKGVGLLIDALPRIRAVAPEVRLTVLGSGTQQHALQSMAASLRLGPSVRFLSKVPRSEVARHCESAALCVLPSVWTENSPLVAYECLHSGLPMVGSRLGGIPELIDPDCGLTFNPGDPEDLARAVTDFLQLPKHQRDAMSSACMARSAMYDLAGHLNQLEAFYATLLSDRQTAPPSDPLLSPDLLSILERAIAAPPPPRQPFSPLQALRALARSLGLPKLRR